MKVGMKGPARIIAPIGRKSLGYILVSVCVSGRCRLVRLISRFDSLANMVHCKFREI